MHGSQISFTVHGLSFSVIIRQLNFERITVIPAKADTVLIIYSNAMQSA